VNVSDAMMRVKFLSGGYIGMVEENFISRLHSGDKFVLARRVLELVRVKEMTAYVRSSSGKAFTPSWLGGCLPLSSSLSQFLREKLAVSMSDSSGNKELKFLRIEVAGQYEQSHIPAEDELCVGSMQTEQ